MTVIVANRELMAADSLLTGGGAPVRTRKIFRVHGHLFGVCGHWEDCQRFLQFLRSGGKDRPKFTDEDTFCALELHPKGLNYWSSACIPTPLDDTFYAIGSGAPAALGAMEMGASPRKAVEVACKYEEHCGPPVRTAKLTTTKTQ
jgi:hypothetical protein